MEIGLTASPMMNKLRRKKKKRKKSHTRCLCKWFNCVTFSHPFLSAGTLMQSHKFSFWHIHTFPLTQKNDFTTHFYLLEIRHRLICNPPVRLCRSHTVHVTLPPSVSLSCCVGLTVAERKRISNPHSLNKHLSRANRHLYLRFYPNNTRGHSEAFQINFYAE